ncbi:MAG: stage 0 sporulation family protein [Clostridia bacterium]|nr:stage 0 sporulation family protein [Clostridia bacterium]
MVEIIGVRFKEVGKIYYFDPTNIKFKIGDMAIVETSRGVEIGEIALDNRPVPEEELVSPLRPVIRMATKEDMQKLSEIEGKEKRAFDLCQEKIKEHKLDMTLIDVEYTFDLSKVLFYFTADGRVDFRELVKSLASIFKTRIELRQIGVRDEAKLLGGIGICGRQLCCKTFLNDFHPVSIKMAKEQNLSLNPTKISGCCGRLMCCLKYENDTYEEMLKYVPKVDAIVSTPDGKGVVVDNNVLSGMIKVKLDDSDITVPQTYSYKDVTIIKDAAIKLTKEEIKALKDLEDK